MIIKPCYRCPLAEGCEKKKEMRLRFLCTGATSIKFVCDILQKEIRVGRRITVLQPVYEDVGSSYEPEQKLRKYPVKATINNAYKYSFGCVIDADQGVDNKYRLRRRKDYYRIDSFLNEPDAQTLKRKMGDFEGVELLPEYYKGTKRQDFDVFIEEEERRNAK